MYIDTQSQFSAAQSIFASGADVVSTNIIDTTPNLSANSTVLMGGEGPGEDATIQISLPTAVTGGTSLQFVLCTDYLNTFNSASYMEFPLSEALPVALLTAGSVWNFRLPNQGLLRYLELKYRNVGANTTGTANAQLAKDVQNNTQFVPAAFTVG